MPGMFLEMRQRRIMIQELQIAGGITNSIFPEVEALLDDTDFQAALGYVSARKKVDRYHSMIDFLFCELHPEWRRACRLFYSDEGPQLKDEITPDQLVEFNKRMLKALEVAYDLFCKHRRKSWRWYCEQVEEALKAA